MKTTCTTSDVRLLRAVELACEQFGCTPTDLAERTMRPTRRGGLRRTDAVVELREKVLYVVRCVTKASYPRLARAMGMPSHSMLVEAFHRVNRRLDGQAVQRVDGGREGGVDRANGELALALVKAVAAVENALKTENIGSRRHDDERQGEEGEEGGGAAGDGARRDEHRAAACER